MVKSNTLSTPIRARYVRIRPWSWYGHISMRVEFYGCYIGKIELGVRPSSIYRAFPHVTSVMLVYQDDPVGRT